MTKAIIIEDEMDAKQLLSRILSDYCPTVKLIGTASNLNKGEQLINELEPDLVFMDIQLGDQTGFQLMDRLEKKSFKLIITTAYEEFALKAFKYEAIDYILKPYSPKSIIAAIGRVTKAYHDSAVYRRLDSLLNNKKTSKKISLPTSEGILLININDILHIEADRSYSNVYLENNTKQVISKSLKDLQELLPKSDFFRIHTSYLINLNKIERYSNEDGGAVIMSDKKRVPIARRRKNEFMELIKSGTGF